jgi:hypothetical protein
MWEDIEDIMAYWHRRANGPAWRDLERLEEQQEVILDLGRDRSTRKLLATIELDILDAWVIRGVRCVLGAPPARS